ncbi:MAG: copper transporter, partial [Acidimicrobiia bacterium]|nr:copper transporter [Acidimicrobiia bacterium]
MLNLRYHVVSLIAVFLALGVGGIVSSTVVDRVTVDQLKTRLDSVEKSVSQTRKDNDKLNAQVHTWEQFADQGRAELFTGQLRGVPVMVVGVDGIDRKSVDDLRTDLSDAGANVQGTLWLTDKLNLRTQAEANALAAALAIPEDNPDVVRAAALSKLATALQGSGDPVGVIPAMQQAGFITHQAPPSPASTSGSTTTPPGPGTIPLPGTRS